MFIEPLSDNLTLRALDAISSLIGVEAMTFANFKIQLFEREFFGFIGASGGNAMELVPVFGVGNYAEDYKRGKRLSRLSLTMRQDSALEIFGENTDLCALTPFGVAFKFDQLIQGVPFNRVTLSFTGCQFTQNDFDTDRSGSEILMKAEITSLGKMEKKSTGIPSVESLVNQF